ncbi:ATP-binding cassette domain-containing protein [Salinarimonas soli]|uniref:ATP-binding cassette domain-containing protein n=1 Tax=Salinarimonas soli TaxID=1638099 RepID=A0A5B2VER3_9HYPH|nr:ATP-binding cassette domain-containing protein [Salinarimonas soli]
MRGGPGPALSVEGVSHRFGAREALSGVSLAVPVGRFVALLGPNGAGKTTLFSIVTRLYHTRQGRVAVFGHNLAREPAQGLARIGVVFQARTLDTDLTVRQNLLYHAALHGLPRRVAMGRVEALLARVGLLDRIDDKIRVLSGGQSRRVEIARSLVHGPSLLLLDEPTVGLDLESRADILATVRALVRDEGISVLWATHIFEELQPDDALVVLHRGRVIADGTAAQVAGGGTLEAAFRRMTALEKAA